MTTSRSGTTRHKRMVAQVLAEAQAQGITHCPLCGVELDYEDRQAPNGAHGDEITPYALTGTTSADINDWQVLCATCNKRKGARMTVDHVPAVAFPKSIQW